MPDEGAMLGHYVESTDDELAVAAAASLDSLAPITRDLVLEAESAEPESGTSDEVIALWVLPVVGAKDREGLGHGARTRTPKGPADRLPRA
jgi:hypothetical protein